MTVIETTPVVDPNIEEDIRLLKRISERDAVSFQAFYKKYSGLIFASISNVLNDHHDTEDVMQEVLVQVWNKAHLYEPRKGKPLTWLTTLARNRAIDRIRSKQRRFPAARCCTPPRAGSAIWRCPASRALRTWSRDRHGLKHGHSA
jgi:RNA polymerase sigma-70 factor (ECF subfamily)